MTMNKIIKNTLISSRPFNILSCFPTYVWLAFISLVISLSACDNPDLNNFKTPLGLDTFGTKSIYVDTIIARTKLMAPLKSLDYTKDLIGCYNNDFNVGKAVASAYINFRLPSYTVKFPAGAKCNSITLTLKYSDSAGYFGNINEEQTWQVFEVTEKLKYDSLYNSNSKPIVNNTPIGSWTGVFVPKDTILTINLDPSFANKLLSAPDTVLSTNDLFTNFFRGIAIIPDENVSQGAIVYFLLNNAKTTLTLKFNDTGKVVFPVNSYSARFANFKHDYTGSEIGKQLADSINNYKTEFNDLILESMAGTQVNIQIPHIKHMIDSGLVAIHRAELFFPVDINSPYYANLPASLLLVKSDAQNQLTNIADRLEVFYGGLLNKSKTGYTFIITRHIQQLLQEYLKNPYYIDKYTLTLIIPSDNPIIASPVLLLNRDQNNKPAITLKIWYSKM